VFGLQVAAKIKCLLIKQACVFIFDAHWVDDVDENMETKIVKIPIPPFVRETGTQFLVLSHSHYQLIIMPTFMTHHFG
jgi:hypothetical protein